MVKQIRLEPLSRISEVDTYSNLLSAILSEDLHVSRECNGRGICATCHIYVKEGLGSLTPMTPRESKTLEVITSAKTNSRLACQARVVSDGVVVELPPGMYVNSLHDVEVLIGRRAEQDLLHPRTGKVLVEQDKVITRSTIKQLENEDFHLIGSTLAQTREV
ncbi:2Fe-2S iron-sulfur cluster-binding protein [Synechococcus sp. Nb3U1]|uniref:2Fe-2S iron-sulfur cluster-binding protein n=1 Tax=Synechococcus sp. Nb3U1 TaxID=1914529 RepID=UPI001F44AB9D|nr:2Fe-2S iron-sulfur cluster-binding protein [Synechococcus sp. Nb3U1]MCF2970868.1 2Fe-2S iron-sulfur cluster-binding protein [Synechococcus sp. Nb3U1]